MTPREMVVRIEELEHELKCAMEHCPSNVTMGHGGSVLSLDYEGTRFVRAEQAVRVEDSEIRTELVRFVLVFLDWCRDETQFPDGPVEAFGELMAGPVGDIVRSSTMFEVAQGRTQGRFSVVSKDENDVPKHRDVCLDPQAELKRWVDWACDQLGSSLHDVPHSRLRQLLGDRIDLMKGATAWDGGD